MEWLYTHCDFLEELHASAPLSRKLKIIHKAVQHYYSFIDRIAVSLYDQDSQILKTFVASSNSENPLVHYEAKLEDAPSLQEIMDLRRPRVVNDLSIFQQGSHQHTQRLASLEYRSSYTYPMYFSNRLIGFLFFNSHEKDCFTPENLNLLDIFGYLTTSLILVEMNAIRTTIAALKMANEMIHYKDPETGAHLERMSRFSRLIAKELARSGKYQFNDEFIETIFNFAPLHDVGKIGIPDEILLKPARLNENEQEVMRTHTLKGRDIAEAIIHNFGIDSLEHIDILKNIAEYHHETLDGGGYPHGLKGETIPIESRIVAVADIFDALTSERPYKPAWTNDEAFSWLQRLAKTKLDQDCVEALLERRNDVETIQKLFMETSSSK